MNMLRLGGRTACKSPMTNAAAGGLTSQVGSVLLAAVERFSWFGPEITA